MGAMTITLLAPFLALHCSLSISFSSGQTQSCSAQIINENTILTAAHCLTEKEGLKNKESPLIIASCGASPLFYVDDFKYSPPIEPIPILNDKVYLHFSEPKLKTKIFPQIAQYKALYFENDGSLKKGVHCFSIGIDSRVIEFGWKNNIIGTTLKLNHQPSEGDTYIESQVTEWRSSHTKFVLTPGDSGSPLFCKSSYFPKYDLIAVTSKELSDSSNPNILFGNRFTPLF